jgi:hypothetical protein
MYMQNVLHMSQEATSAKQTKSLLFLGLDEIYEMNIHSTLPQDFPHSFCHTIDVCIVDPSK